jgi:PAS domain S-box-containing protein
MNSRIKFLNLTEHFWDIPDASDENSITVWRQRLFNVIFLTTAILVFLPYAISMVNAIHSGRLAGSVIYTIFYLLLIGIVLVSRIHFKIRAWIGMFVFYALGFFALLTLGIQSSGRMYLLCFSVISCLLLGFRAGLISIALNAITMAVISWLAIDGRLNWAEKITDLKDIWLVLTATFLWLNTILTVSLGVLIRNLERELEKEQALVQTIREAETRYRLLAENTVDCIWQMNSDLKFTYVNPAVFHQFGFTPEEWMNKDLLEHCAPGEMEKIRAKISDLMHQIPEDKTYSFETCFFHKNGSEIPVEIIGRLLTDDAGNFKGLQGSTRNIARRRQAQSILKESEHRSKIILNSIQTGIVIINAHTHEILDINPSALRMIGASEKDRVIGHICHQYICPAEKGKCPITDLEQTIDQSDRKLLTITGEERSILKTVSHITLDGQECLLENFTDITHRRRLERQLQQSQKMEAIGTLAGGIAHDFNNILTGIFGYAQLADFNLDDDKHMARENIKSLVKGAQRAKDLVRQILAFSRQNEQRKMPLKLSVIVKEAVKFLRSTIPTTVVIKEEILSRSMILADPTMTHQVVMNLCTNAYHAMRESGGTLTIGLEDINIPNQICSAEKIDLPGNHIKLEVKDTGHGMDKKTLEKIFDPYFTTKESDKGTGLGLAVVDGIVRKHKGFIKTDSKVGGGTTFQVFWPRLEQEGLPGAPKGEEMESSGGTEQILLVDDEADILDTLKIILERQGYGVTVFKGGGPALQAFSEAPDFFDLVITDMTMPSMTGDRLSAEILNIREDIPVILCTGHHENFSADKARKIGIKKYIQKPLTGRELSVLIREILDEKMAGHPDKDLKNGKR